MDSCTDTCQCSTCCRNRRALSALEVVAQALSRSPTGVGGDDTAPSRTTAKPNNTHTATSASAVLESVLRRGGSVLDRHRRILDRVSPRSSATLVTHNSSTCHCVSGEPCHEVSSLFPHGGEAYERFLVTGELPAPPTRVGHPSAVPCSCGPPSEASAEPWTVWATTAQPVFIVGCGRSGTTLLLRCLTTMCDVVALNEARVIWIDACPALDVWSAKAASRRGTLSATAKSAAHAAPHVAAAVSRGSQVCGEGHAVASKDEEERKGADASTAVTEVPPSQVDRLRQLFYEQCVAVAMARQHEAGCDCRGKNGANRAGGGCKSSVCATKLPVLVEKLPENSWRIPLLAQAFPRCRVLHVIRDGRAVARSIARFSPAAWYGSTGHKWACVRQLVAPVVEPQPHADSCGASSGGDPAMECRGLTEWASAVTTARSDAATAGLAASGRYEEVRFEELVRAPTPTLARLSRFVSGAPQQGRTQAIQPSTACVHVHERVVAMVNNRKAELPASYTLPAGAPATAVAMLEALGYTEHV